MKPKSFNVQVSGIYLTPRLVIAYSLGKIARTTLIAALTEEHITDGLIQADIIGYLDSLRPSDVTEVDSAECRCGRQGYISLDPYSDEIDNELVLDVYCEDCFMEDADEI